MADTPDEDKAEGRPRGLSTELRGLLSDLDVELARVDRLLDLTAELAHSKGRPEALALKAGLLRARERLWALAYPPEETD